MVYSPTKKDDKVINKSVAMGSEIPTMKTIIKYSNGGGPMNKFSNSGGD